MVYCCSCVDTILHVVDHEALHDYDEKQHDFSTPKYQNCLSFNHGYM